MPDESPIFELRRYRLQQGKRETLLELFEREFVVTQEAAGITLHGFYRDAHDPDAFVWMRSFPDMERRTRALIAFYGGDVWKKWGAEANATMLNSDNVLLLKAAGPARSFVGEYGATGVITISICSLAPGRAADFAAGWESNCRSILEACGARIDATFITDQSVNGFPRLPVRQGATVFVWVSAFLDEAHYHAHNEALRKWREWTLTAFPWLDAQLWRPVETAVLTPTRPSRHGW